MSKVMFGKYGLKGKSGLTAEYSKPEEVNKVQIIHISSNYDSNGKVFVLWKSRRWGWTWKRMTQERAKKEKREIITCCKCHQPAVSLDHYYPYDSMFNRCKKHYGS